MAVDSRVLIVGDKNGVRQYVGIHGLTDGSWLQLTSYSELEGHHSRDVHLVGGWGRLLTFADLTGLEHRNNLNFIHDNG